MSETPIRSFVTGAKAAIIRLPRNLLQRRNLAVFGHDIVILWLGQCHQHHLECYHRGGKRYSVLWDYDDRLALSSGCSGVG